MKTTLFYQKYLVNKNLPLPLYQQLVDAVIHAIQENELAIGDRMPSINQLSTHFNVTRGTIEKSYSDLREMGILGSFHGKGFYIHQTRANQERKILLLFNKLSTYKKIIYDAFIETIGTNSLVDFSVYNNSAAQFCRIMKEKSGKYSHYVIMPHFDDDPESALLLIESLPKDQLILLDNHIQGISGEYGAVYENFSLDIFQALTQVLPQLKKYSKFNLVFPETGYFPKKISEGFRDFCATHYFEYRITSKIEFNSIRQGEAYIVIPDDQLHTLLDHLITLKYIPGIDVGIVSYNESNSKKLIMNGITTISTDFKLMGQTAAKFILTGLQENIKNPFYLTLRSSL